MTTATSTARLLNPGSYDAAEFDPATQRLFRATIDWFEAKGARPPDHGDGSDTWYADFIEFLACERAFATLLTPARDAGADPDKRWDTARNAVFNEILGFYGLPYWYAWQVTILGLGPVWQSDNEAARERAAGCSRRARCSPSACPESASTVPTSTRRTWSSRRMATVGSAPAAASTTSATATSRAWCRCSAGAPTSKDRRATCSSPPTASTRRTTWSERGPLRRCTSARSSSRTIPCAPRTSCAHRHRGPRRR